MRTHPSTPPGFSRRSALAIAALPMLVTSYRSLARSAPRDEALDADTIVQSLDGVWKFRTDPYSVGEREAWFAPALDVARWDDMTVPGVWDVINDYAEYAGVGWYRTSFVTDAAWSGKLVRLIFDGVYDDATVWLNGRLLGTNDIGYLPFQFDLDTLAPAGERNHLVVRADNRTKGGAVWNWGGIRRPVRLEITAPTRVETLWIDADPDLASGAATVAVRVRSRVAAGSGAQPGARLSLVRDGVIVWTSSPVRGRRGGSGAIDFAFAATLRPEQVALWHFNTPHLYTARVDLLVGDTVVHALSRRFGIRKVELAGEKLLLNGESIRTVGFNVVADDRRTGSALPLSRIKADVDLLKMLGANMARLSHQSLPDEYLDYLDEVGMLVVDEIPIWGKSDLVDPQSDVAISWLTRMIQAHYNHPSIIGWSVGNEIGRRDRNPQVMGYVRRATAHAKALDPRRFAVYISNTASREAEDPVAFSDIIMLNSYHDLSRDLDQAHKLHPGKPIFMSEYGDKVDSEDPNAATVSGERFLSAMRGKPYVIGASLWTFNDYRSTWPGWDSSPATPASQNRSWGVVTVDRRPKRSFFSYRSAHAPFRLTVRQKEGGWTVAVAPRGPLDLPAYVARGYHLLWRAANGDDAVIAAGVSTLPTLAPGSAPVALTVPGARGAMRLLVDLIDPQGYSLLTVTRDLTPPKAPVIRRLHTSGGSVRIVFDRVPRADEYAVVYTGPDGERRTPTSINGFIDVAGLKLDQSYGFRVVAINSAGESAPSRRVEATTDRDDLPPILWSVQSADGAVFVNYSTDQTDFIYELEVRDPDGGDVRTLTTTTRGVTRIPGLDNGKTYRLRMRRGNALGFPLSEWTEAVSATPRGAGGLPAPAGAYLVPATGGRALLVFDPVEGATGYEARFGARVVRIGTAASGTAFVRVDDATWRGTLCAIDDFGKPGATVAITRRRARG